MMDKIEEMDVKTLTKEIYEADLDGNAIALDLCERFLIKLSKF
jgi:hypothetical protein